MNCSSLRLTWQWLPIKALHLFGKISGAARSACLKHALLLNPASVQVCAVDVHPLTFACRSRGVWWMLC